MRLACRGVRVFAIAVLAVVGLAGAGLRLGVFPWAGERQTLLASFTEREVGVQISLVEKGAAGAWLVGVFSPTRPHFHLYSKDLPRGGLEGLGRPTLLEIVSGNTLRPVAPLTADQTAKDEYLEVLKLSLPVYPEGAVTLRLPVSRTSGETAPLELSVTYMACSAGVCLPPVVDKHIWVSAAAPNNR